VSGIFKQEKVNMCNLLANRRFFAAAVIAFAAASWFNVTVSAPSERPASTSLVIGTPAAQPDSAPARLAEGKR
jgi:hypothetical protein